LPHRARPSPAQYLAPGAGSVDERQAVDHGGRLEGPLDGSGELAPDSEPSPIEARLVDYDERERRPVESMNPT